MWCFSAWREAGSPREREAIGYRCHRQLRGAMNGLIIGATGTPRHDFRHIRGEDRWAANSAEESKDG